MQSPAIESTRGRGIVRIFSAIFAALLVTAGLSAAVLVSETVTADAATVTFNQCNYHEAGDAGAALSVTCSIDIINTIDATGGTSSRAVFRLCTLNGCTGDSASSNDLVNIVNQCNNSDNGAASVMICDVSIVNNIYTAGGGGAPTAITVHQCDGSGEGGGSEMTACIERAEGGASPNVNQCNGSGNGGGANMTCTATGTSSAAFPISVIQCNDSENAGGSTVICHTSILNNFFDTETGSVPPAGTTPGTGSVPTGPGTGTPGEGTPTEGTPEGFGPPEAGTPPFVVVPPGFTG